jgi:hypothetical protein
MKEIDEELWKLGVSAKTKHNEVAPSQHELALVYTNANIAVDHNQITMEVLKRVAERHNLACLLHEKPFVTVYDITALPAATPVIVPDVPTVATAKSELDHTPPAGALLRLVVRFWHTVVVPVIAVTTGSGFTVTAAVASVIHPKPLVTL